MAPSRRKPAAKPTTTNAAAAGAAAAGDANASREESVVRTERPLPKKVKEDYTQFAWIVGQIKVIKYARGTAADWSIGLHWEGQGWIVTLVFRGRNGHDAELVEVGNGCDTKEEAYEWLLNEVNEGMEGWVDHRLSLGQKVYNH